MAQRIPSGSLFEPVLTNDGAQERIAWLGQSYQPVTQQALALEPRLLLNPSRCRILRKGVSEDSHQLFIALEGEIDQCLDRFGTDSPPPLFASDPVTDLMDMGKLASTQVDGPDQQSTV